MSRSRRKTPIFGMTIAATDKPFKTLEHRRARRAANSNPDSDCHPKKFGNPWQSQKDGKHYWLGAKPKDMRK